MRWQTTPAITERKNVISISVSQPSLPCRSGGGNIIIVTDEAKINNRNHVFCRFQNTVLTNLHRVWYSIKVVKSIYGGLAQLGERLPCKQEVTSSTLVFSTDKEKSELRDEFGFFIAQETLFPAQ